MPFIVKPKTDFQEKTFTELMTLVSESNGEFIFSDHPIPNNENLIYRIFKYSLPGYMSFKKPSAKQCRGSMFLVDKKANTAQLIALPMEKFFSVGEGVGDDLKIKITDAKRAFIKQDGSLLTSYLDPFTETVNYKSMGAPTYISKSVIEKSIPNELAQELQALAIQNVCVDLELTTPENRVIIEYKTYRVYALKARCVLTGQNINIRSEEFKELYPAIAAHLVEEIPTDSIDLNRSDIEGYVIELADSSIKKIKTLPYLSMVGVIKLQDFSKESLYLYKAAVNNVLDEVRGLYVHKAFSEAYNLAGKLEKADRIQAYATATYNPFVRGIESLYEENKHLSKSEYCKKLNKEPGFPLLLSKFTGQPVTEADYRKFAIEIFGKKAPN